MFREVASISNDDRCRRDLRNVVWYVLKENFDTNGTIMFPACIYT